MNTLDAHAISAAILTERGAILAGAASRQRSKAPAGLETATAALRQADLGDADFNLSHLAQAIALESPELYQDFAGWFKILRRRRLDQPQDIVDQFQHLEAGLCDVLSPAVAAVACRYVDDVLHRLPEMPDDLPGSAPPHGDFSQLAHRYLEALLRGDRRIASRLVLDAVALGMSVKDVYLGVFQVCQHEIGRLWQTNQISVAQEHFCTAASQLIMSQLFPHIFASERRGLKVVATAVAGDLHAIGARMVADFFEMDGWQTYYLGSNCPHADVIACLAEHRPHILVVSATISFHLDAVAALIRAVRMRSDLAAVKILVGGRAFNRDSTLWRKLGADGWAGNAQQAIVLARRLRGGLES